MKEKIKTLLIEIKENPVLFSDLPENAHMINDIGLDSLQMLSFILKVEQEFGIEIDFESFDFSHLDSVDAFCDFLQSQKNPQGLAI